MIKKSIFMLCVSVANVVFAIEEDSNKYNEFSVGFVDSLNFTDSMDFANFVDSAVFAESTLDSSDFIADNSLPKNSNYFNEPNSFYAPHESNSNESCTNESCSNKSNSTPPLRKKCI